MQLALYAKRSIMANKSYRIMYRFWLDITKPSEKAIADKIDLLKNERSFTSVIRDGIRLVSNLRDGKLDVLFELFPWVRAEFLNYIREALPLPEENTIEIPQLAQQIEADRIWKQHRLGEAHKIEQQKVEEERKRVEAERQENQSSIQKQLERLEELLLQQDNKPIKSASENLTNDTKKIGAGGFKLRSSEQSQGIGLKGISPKITFAPPNFDDDDDIPELEMKKSEGRGVAKFLEAIANHSAHQ